MGIEPTQDLLGPTLVLKTRGTTRHQSPPRHAYSCPDVNYRSRAPGKKQEQPHESSIVQGWRGSWREHRPVSLLALDLLVEHHRRRTGEADTHPGGFVDFVLRKAFASSVLQVHFQTGLAPQGHRKGNGHRLLRVGVQMRGANWPPSRNCLNVALTWSVPCGLAALARARVQRILDPPEGGRCLTSRQRHPHSREPLGLMIDDC